jgi:hypothetical protein
VIFYLVLLHFVEDTQFELSLLGRSLVSVLGTSYFEHSFVENFWDCSSDYYDCFHICKDLTEGEINK